MNRRPTVDLATVIAIFAALAGVDALVGLHVMLDLATRATPM